MKKSLSLLTILSSFFFISSAHAKDGLNIGADFILSNASYKFKDPVGTSFNENRSGSQRSDALGGGVSLGYKKSLDTFFVNPELFYDYLNSSSQDYHYPNYPNTKQNSLELKNRYGAKLNFGMDVTEKLSSYLSYGFANIDYSNRLPSFNSNEKKHKVSAIYGLGALYQINDHFALKAEFSRQKFNIRYSIDGAGVISQVRLHTLKTGIVYSF